jgi:hypothetical protein
MVLVFLEHQILCSGMLLEPICPSLTVSIMNRVTTLKVPIGPKPGINQSLPTPFIYSAGVPYNYADSAIRANNSVYGGRQWDPITSTPWYAFMDEWGMWGQGFYDDPQSLAIKYAWVKAQQVNPL